MEVRVRLRALGEEGATTVEYALMLALIALALLATATALSAAIHVVFATAQATLS